MMWFLVAFVVFTLIRGATLDVFWEWFIMPVFPGAPDLTLGTALGVSLVVAFVTLDVGTARADDDDAMLIAKGAAFYIIVWAMAIVYHYFFGVGLES